jgi:hypothetical protein
MCKGSYMAPKAAIRQIRAEQGLKGDGVLGSENRIRKFGALS